MPGVATRSIRRRSGRDAGRTADYDGWQRNVGLRTFTSHVKPAAHFVRLYGEKNIMHVDYVSRTVTFGAGQPCLRRSGAGPLRLARRCSS